MRSVTFHRTSCMLYTFFKIICFPPRLFSRGNTWMRQGVIRLLAGWLACLCLIFCKLPLGASRLVAGTLHTLAPLPPPVIAGLLIMVAHVIEDKRSAWLRLIASFACLYLCQWGRVYPLQLPLLGVLVFVFGTSLRMLMLAGGYCSFRSVKPQVAAVVSTCYELDGDMPFWTRKMTLMTPSPNI